LPERPPSPHIARRLLTPRVGKHDIRNSGTLKMHSFIWRYTPHPSPAPARPRPRPAHPLPASPDAPSYCPARLHANAVRWAQSSPCLREESPGRAGPQAAPAGAGENMQGLSHRMRVPGGARPRLKTDAEDPQADGSAPTATSSMKTFPVNQATGPLRLARALLLRIFMATLLADN